MRPVRRLLGLLAAAVLLIGLSVAVHTVPAGAAPTRAAPTMRPMIFVHGFFGSGGQIETQAKRFASNGYPANYVQALDYDSLFVNNSVDQVYAALDQRIAALKAATGADKVELLGHSLGTAMSQGYLNSSAARAANVAHYVNIDGGAASALPGGVPTLAIWGEGGQSRSIPGATNVYSPNESHVQTTSSVATFQAAYRFFTGQEPATTDVVPQSGTIQLGGRAVYFPYNTGYQGAKVDVYQLNAATGQRASQTPVASFTLGQDGSFGPFNASGTAFYEFAATLTTSTGQQFHHFYYQPFRRTDLGIRLLSDAPGGLVDQLIERNAAHSVVLTYRDKEWWGDQGANGDTLRVNGTDVVNATTAPRGKRAIGIFNYDWHSDKVTNVNQTIGLFPVLPFMSGADIYLPANAAGSGSIVFDTVQRAGSGQTARIVTPNWSSSNHVITVHFDDYA